MINHFKLAPSCAALICSLTLLGCSSTVLHAPKDENPSAFISSEEASSQLSEVTSCCDDLQKLNYEQLSDDTVQYLAFDNRSPAYDFASGKSFYKAYRLDANISELTVRVDGLFYNTVFAPQVMLLDSQFKQTRIIRANKFTYQQAKLLNGDELNASFTINRPNLNNPANETYFIIYSTNEAMQGSTTITHPAKLDAQARSLVEPDIADPVINHSAMGVVKLQFELINKDDRYIALEPEQSDSYIAPESTTQSITSKSNVNKSTETQYNQQILSALANNEIAKALQLVEQAEAAGSTSARSTFVEAIKK